MVDLEGFPDIERAVAEVLADLGTVDSVTPPDLLAAMPFIRVTRIGGPSTRITDGPRVDVSVYTASRAASYALAERCQQRLINVPHVTSFGLIDSCDTDQAPHEVPWGDETVRHFTASYSLSSRR